MYCHGNMVGGGSILCTTVVVRRWFYTVYHHGKVVGGGSILCTTMVMQWAVVLYCVPPW